MTPLPFHDIDVGIWTTDSAAPQIDVELGLRLSRQLHMPVDVRRLNSRRTTPDVSRADVDYDRVFDTLMTDLDDLRAFSTSMASLL
jgi:hypothetical protein